MSEMVNWSDLPEELVDVIANGLFSSVELHRFRSICKPWRSAVASKKRFPKHRKLHRRRFLSSYKEKACSLFPAAFFRVIPSPSPNKGWLIKTQDVYESRKNLLCPLSRRSIQPSEQTLDLLDFTVSEIHQSYGVHLRDSDFMSYRSVLVDNLVFAVDYNKKIWWCNSGESSSNQVWKRILDEEAKFFSDIIVHKGQIYALDLTGAIWWISLSDLKIFQYGPSTPMEYYEIDDCKDRRLVEYCGDLCIVHRLCNNFYEKRRGKVERTVGFKVYKMDVELVKWVEVKSLGDEAFIMATDSCFSVLAREYYGCLENSIYFIDEKDQENVKVFKLGDGSINSMVESSSQSCFQMFSPPFAS